MPGSYGGREYWDLGERYPFRLSKDQCQKLVYALTIFGGRIHDTSVLNKPDGKLHVDRKPHETTVLFRISLPPGLRDCFEKVMDSPCLTPPIRIRPSRY